MSSSSCFICPRNSWPMIEEISSHVALSTGFGPEQESLLYGSLNTDTIQGSGLDPEQIKWTRSGLNDFFSRNAPLVLKNMYSHIQKCVHIPQASGIFCI